MIQKLKEDNAQYVEKIKMLNNNGNKLQSKINEYQKKIMEAKEEIAGFTKICSEHEEMQECLRKELKRKDKELADLNQELEEMKTLAQKYSGKLMVISDQNEELEKEKASIVFLNDQLNNKIDELSKKLKEHGNYSEEIAILNQEIQTLEKSNQIKEEMFKKMNKIIRKLNKKANENKDESFEDCENIIKELETYEDLSEKNNALRREIELLHSANNELEKKLEDDQINCEEKSKLLEKLQIYAGKFKQSLKQNRKLIQLVEKLQKCHETCSRCNSEETWSYYNDNEDIASSEISLTEETEESLNDVEEYDESD